jgi:hypothetical protein
LGLLLVVGCLEVVGGWRFVDFEFSSQRSFYPLLSLFFVLSFHSHNDEATATEKKLLFNPRFNLA